MKQQSTLMKFDPVTGADKPYPSHAVQWRDWHGHATAWLFNPWTGEKRDARNIGSDIVGLLIIPPNEPIYLERSLSGDLMDCVDRLGSEAETIAVPDAQAQSADIPGLKETCRAAAYAAYNEVMTHIEVHGPDAESNTDNSQPVGGFVDQPVAPEQSQEPVLMTWQEVEDTHTAEPVHSAEDIDKALVMKPSNVPETPTHDFQATEKMPDEAWMKTLSMLELRQPTIQELGKAHGSVTKDDKRLSWFREYLKKNPMPSMKRRNLMLTTVLADTTADELISVMMNKQTSGRLIVSNPKQRGAHDEHVDTMQNSDTAMTENKTPNMSPESIVSDETVGRLIDEVAPAGQWVADVSPAQFEAEVPPEHEHLPLRILHTEKGPVDHSRTQEDIVKDNLLKYSEIPHDEKVKLMGNHMDKYHLKMLKHHLHDAIKWFSSCYFGPKEGVCDEITIGLNEIDYLKLQHLFVDTSGTTMVLHNGVLYPVESRTGMSEHPHEVWFHLKTKRDTLFRCIEDFCEESGKACSGGNYPRINRIRDHLKHCIKFFTNCTPVIKNGFCENIFIALDMIDFEQLKRHFSVEAIKDPSKQSVLDCLTHDHVKFIVLCEPDLCQGDMFCICLKDPEDKIYHHRVQFSNGVSETLYPTIVLDDLTVESIYPASMSCENKAVDDPAAEDWEPVNDNKHAFVIDDKNRCIIRKNKSGKTHVVGGVRVIHPKGVLKAYQAIARVVESEHDVSDKRLARCVEFHVFTELKVASLLLEKTIDEKIICSLDETGTKFRAAKMGIMREIDLLKFPESQRNVFLQAADKAKQRYIACTTTA